MMLMMKFVSITELLIYHTVMLLLLTRVFGAKSSKRSIVLSYLLTILPPVVFELAVSDTMVYFIPAGMQLVLMPVFVLLFDGIRLRTVFSLYAVIFLVCLILTSSLLMVFPDEEWIELLTGLVIHFVILGICIVICCTRLRNRVKMLVEWTPVSTKRILLILLLGNTVLAMAIYRLSFYNSPTLLNFIKFIFMVLLMTDGVAVSVLLIYAVTNKRVKKVADHYQKQIVIQADYYRKLSESNFELRQYRHDSSNICIGLEKLLEDGRTEEALTVVRNQMKKLKSVQKGFDTGNAVADALLSDKCSKAQKQNAEIQFEGMLPGNAVSPTDLCVILGNTLDNAIEACEKIGEQDKKIIRINSQCQCGFLFIEICNPVAEPVAIEDKIPHTTKADKTEHGFGMFSLLQVVRSYGGSMVCSCDNLTFSVCISLELRRKKGLQQ